MKKLIALCLTLVMALTMTGAALAELDTNVKATLTFATFDNEAMLLFDELDIEGRFQELFPRVSIEIEEFKDDDEYFKQMKIRASANELPDVMYLQTRYFPVFKNYMVDLSALEATKNNVMAESYALDGVVLGIPEKRSEDYVFYWADMFEEAGVSVPKTWEELNTVLETLQNYYGAKDPNFAAIAVGVKDAWPVYPFMEYAPASFSGNGTYWDLMATQNEPFAEGTEIREAYTKVYNLFSKGVLGADPLGIGYDQALSLFLNKSACMMADNSMGLAKIKNSGVDLSNLKTFYMPYTTEDGSFNHIVQGDFFMGVTNTSENQELAKAFVEFFFSEAWYPDYISRLASDSTMVTVHKDKDPYMVFADQEQPELTVVGYVGGGDDYTAIVNESKWDYCKLGAEMLMEGFDLNAAFDKLNADWSAAREKLGMN
ncbi:MAG: ABC transporter substrate-binding protein [bacterium]|nr:ABC transporter substrate-binding protein [bacterium]